jgi:beta-lactamase class A
MIDRRTLVAATLALAAAPAAARSRSEPELAAIRARTGGRLGVFALDTGSGRSLGLDADARYAMASTFKLPLAAAVLAEVDAGRRRLDETVPFTAADLLEYAPYVRANATKGALPIVGLAQAAVEVSDNSAANLLLPLIGGPAGLTRFCRAHGDRTTRLDRNEPDLNTNLAGDPRDTTTPAAMVGLLRRLLVGKALSAASRERLIGWLVACETGKARIRAGLPADWRAGDKTGTGARGAANDLAILWPPRRAPILVACFVDAEDAKPADRDAAHAAVAALVARRFA